MPDPVGLPPVVAAAVVGSALLHASWNAVAKAIPYRLLASALIGTSGAAVGVVWSRLTPVPLGPSWPYLVASSVLQTVYLLLLTAAYGRGEFRRVYPVARGSAPLLVTIVSLTALGEHLAAGQLVGIALVIAALAVLASMPRSRPRTGTASGLGLALATGVMIAAYTLVDGIGVRQSGSAAGYAAWSLVVHGPLLVTTCLILAGPRQMIGWLRGDGGAGDSVTNLADHPTTGGAAPARTPATDGAVIGHAPAGDDARDTARGSIRSPRHRPAVMITAGLLGGIFSLAAYAIVLWAQSRASLSLVSALRETSVLFAGLIGALLFAERFTARQTVAALGVVAGIALMQLA